MVLGASPCVGPAQVIYGIHEHLYSVHARGVHTQGETVAGASLLLEAFSEDAI